MKIVPYILLFLLITTSDLSAQGLASQSRASSNILPHRSYMQPASSVQEAAQEAVDAMRFALPIEDWEQLGGSGGAIFTSSFAVPFSWIGRQSIISIESASAPYSVMVGAEVVGNCFNPSMPAQFNVTNQIERDGDNPITITMQSDSQSAQLESWSLGNKSLELGRVVMLSQPTMHIRDLEVETTMVSGTLNSTVSIMVKSEALNPRSSRINYELIDPSGAFVTRGYTDLNLSMRQEDTIRMFFIIPENNSWSADNPNLYRLNLSTQYRGRQMEYFSFEIGMRSIELGDQGELKINGVSELLKVKEIDSSIEMSQLSQLKAEGYNAVKIAAGVHNAALYSATDSLGLYVIATAPINSEKSGENILRGGNPTNDPARLDEYIERVDAIYNTTRVHPSVVAYSLADNSLNGINLYESYLYLKSREPHRPIIYLGGGGEWNNDTLKIEF